MNIEKTIPKNNRRYTNKDINIPEDHGLIFMFWTQSFLEMQKQIVEKLILGSNKVLY